MAREFDPKQALYRLRQLVQIAENHRKRVNEDPESLMYFTLGGYANDSYQIIKLFKELDEYLKESTYPIDFWHE